MIDDKDWFMREPREGFAMEMLSDYKPKTTEELAEWILIAAKNLVDGDGLLIYSPLKPFMAYQMARMMQKANLKIPKGDK
jgi:hypothetical protein